MEVTTSTQSPALPSLEPDQAERDAASKGQRADHRLRRFFGLLEPIVQLIKPRGQRSRARADSLSRHSDHILKDIGLRRDEVEPLRSVRTTHLRSWL